MITVVSSGKADECLINVLAQYEAGKLDKDGWGALMYAAKGGYLECAELLLREKVLKNNECKTVLDIAISCGKQDIVDLLSW